MNTVLAHWSASWPVLIAYLAVALAHLAGLRRLMAATAGGDRPGLLREAAMVHAGLMAQRGGVRGALGGHRGAAEPATISLAVAAGTQMTFPMTGGRRRKCLN